MQQFEQLTQQMQHHNAISQHGRILSSMEKAIALAQAMRKPRSEVIGLQQRCLDILVADINRELPALSVAHRVSHIVPTSLSEALGPTPPTRRRRVLNDSQTQAIQQIEAIGNIEENPGEGNCLFYCLAAIENDYLEMRGARRVETTHILMRADVVDTLRADSALVQVARVRDIGASTQHAVFAEDDMVTQKGSVDEYCDWMQQDGISGRSVRTVKFLAPCARTDD